MRLKGAEFGEITQTWEP